MIEIQPISTGLWQRLENHLENRSPDTNKIVTPQPEKVNTWQPPHALEWVPIFQAPSKDSQGI